MISPKSAPDSEVGEESQQAFSILNVVKVAGAFIALLIGSGFATGQEVLQFFAVDGIKGVWGSGIFLGLCTYVSVSLLLDGYKHGFRNSEEVFCYYAGPVFGRVFTWYTLFVIYSVFGLMLAGGGSVLHEHLGWPVWTGSALLAMAVFLTLYFGLRELLDVLGFLGPVLVGLILAVCIVTVFRHPEGIEAGAAAAREMDLLRASGSWWWSGLLYSTLQIMALFSFLPAAGATMGNRREAVAAGILGPFLFFATLVLVIMALLVRMPNLEGKMIPMLDIANHALPAVGSAFALVIMVGIFTTIAPFLWVLLVKFTTDGSGAYRLLSVPLCLGGLLGSLYMPFDRFMNIIYPTIGYSGILLVLLLLVRQTRERLAARRQ
jgi:uncharacterized membrane protein YkvI